MYDRTYWANHTVDQYGGVIQVGTPVDQAHLNKLERGVSDQGLAAALMHFQKMQDGYNRETEIHVVNLAQNSMPWPFNNRETTVALKSVRESTNYSVEIGVLSYSGGRLGAIRVVDRAKNGFKLLHDGSATEIKVCARVSGGMTDPII